MSDFIVAIRAMLNWARGVAYEHIDNGDGTHTIIIVPTSNTDCESKP